jgi:hypothetical protein
MITSALLSIILPIVNYFIGLLPAVDGDIVTKEYNVIGYGIDHFLVLGYYYLPMDTISWWFTKTLAFTFIILGLWLMNRLITVLTGNKISLPWAK